MPRQPVLAVSSDLDQLRRIVANLERAGAEVDAVRSPAAVPGRAELGQIPHRYVFFAAESASAAPLMDTLPSFRDQAYVVVILPAARLPDVVGLMADPRIHHVIVGDEELDQGVFIAAQKLLTGDIFGIEKYLPEGTPVQYIRIHDQAGRDKAVETVVEFASRSRLRRQVRSAIAQVSEELLMNALYDAPTDEAGNLVFADTPPRERRGMVSPRPVSMRYAATETQFAISVRDRFGRLAKNTIVAYLQKCLTRESQIDRKTHGAGLGLYLVANAAAGLVVNVAYGIATEVVCTFDRGAKTPLRLAGVFVHPNNEELLREGPVPEGAGTPDPGAEGGGAPAGAS